MRRYRPNHDFAAILREARDEDTDPAELEQIADEAFLFREKSIEIIKAVVMNPNAPFKTVLKVGKKYPGLALCSPVIQEHWSSYDNRRWPAGLDKNAIRVMVRSFLEYLLIQKIDPAMARLYRNDKLNHVPVEIEEISSQYGWPLGKGVYEKCVEHPDTFEYYDVGLSVAMREAVVIERFLDIMGEGFVYPAEASEFVSKMAEGY